MWIFVLLLLPALWYVGLKLYRIETEQPFSNPQAGVKPVSRAAVAPVMAAPTPRKDVKRNSGYEKLLTNAEAACFEALKSALGEEHHIFAKVRMGDLLEPVAQSPRERKAALDEVRSERVDFVVCRNRTWEIVAAVELDEPNQKAPGEHDQFVNEVFQQTAIPLIRIPAEASSRVEEIAARFAKLSAPAVIAPVPMPAPKPFQAPNRSKSVTPAVSVLVPA